MPMCDFSRPEGWRECAKDRYAKKQFSTFITLKQVKFCLTMAFIRLTAKEIKMAISATAPLREQVLPAPIRDSKYLALRPTINPTPYVESKPLAPAPVPETQVPPSRPLEILNLRGEVTGTRINTSA